MSTESTRGGSVAGEAYNGLSPEQNRRLGLIILLLALLLFVTVAVYRTMIL